MAEIAALGLRVDGVEGVTAATAALDAFAKAATAAEVAAADLGAKTTKPASGLDALTKAADRVGATGHRGATGLDALTSAAADAGVAAGVIGTTAATATRGADAITDLGYAAEDAAQKVKKTGDASKAAGANVGGLAQMAKRAAGAIAAAFAVKELIGYADAWSDMQSRVTVSISSFEDSAEVMGRLGDIARMTYSDLGLTADAFARNSMTLKALGKTTQEQLDYTEALNNALVVSGAKGQQAVMVQGALGRAMSEGALRGEELRTVLNYGSRVAEVLAKNLSTDVTGLRALGAEGKITGEIIYESLTGNMRELAAEAERMPATIGDGFTVLKNSVLQAVGVLDQQAQLSGDVAEGIVAIGDAIRGLDAGQLRAIVDVSAMVALVMGSRLAGAAAQAGIALLATKAQAAGAAIAVAQLGGASTVAAVRVTAMAAASRAAGAAMALMGGPAGAVLLAAGAITYFATRTSEAEREADALDARLAKLGGSFERMNAAQAAAALLDYNKALEAAEKEQAAAQKRLDELTEVIDTVTERHREAARAQAASAGSMAGYTVSAAAIARELGGVTDQQTRANGAVSDAADRIANLKEKMEQLQRIANGKPLIAPEEVAKTSKAFDDLNSQISERMLLIGKTTDAEKLAARIQGGFIKDLKAGEGELLITAQKSLDAALAKEAAQQKASEAARRRSEQAAQAQQAIRDGIDSELAALNRAVEIHGKAADAVKLYDLAAKGATVTELKRAEALLASAAAQRALAEEAQWQADTNAQAQAVFDSLATEEEAILASYERRRGLILASTEATAAEVTEALSRLEAERDEQLLAINGSYWEQWLAAAETALTSFDELAAGVVEGFSSQMGSALESVVFDFESLSDAAQGVIEAMARSMVNALGQMAAQWLAYQAVQMIAGKTAQAAAVTMMAANAQATAMQAALAAFASTAAVPIVGPALAPAAAAAALAATQPVAMAIAATAASGMAHDGLDRVPADGTWLLQKGERVTTEKTSAKLDATLDRVERGQGGSAAPITVNIHNAPPGSRAQESQGPDGERVIDVWLADFYGDGRTATAVKNRFGLAPQGR